MSKGDTLKLEGSPLLTRGLVHSKKFGFTVTYTTPRPSTLLVRLSALPVKLSALLVKLSGLLVRLSALTVRLSTLTAGPTLSPVH